MHPCERAESRFCSPGLLFESVVMLFECQVRIHPDSQPQRLFLVKPNDAVFNLDFGCQFRPEVLPMASPPCEECTLRLGSIELEISSPGPFDALHCAGFELLNQLVHVSSGCHGPEVIHEGEAFDPLDFLFHLFYQPGGVHCAENWRHRRALWDACFYRMQCSQWARRASFRSELAWPASDRPGR